MRHAIALLAALCAAAASIPAAGADTGGAACGDSGYSYAGLGGTSIASGVSARIRLNDLPRVQSGHVAAWVGLGGYGAGKNGTTAWIQAGLIRKAGEPAAVYYEVTRPGHRPELVKIAEAKPGHAYRIAVREARAGRWQVAVDGRTVSKEILLPGSHGRWEATATAESWDGGGPACNRFDVGFESLEVRDGRGVWRPFGRAITLEAPGYRVARRTLSGFRAVG